MKIEIEAVGYVPGKALKQFATCCVGFELGAQKNQIESVLIQLADAGQIRDGKQQSCLVQVELAERHEVITKVSDPDLHIAIHRALERASWMVAHRLQREQEKMSGVALVEQAPAAQPEGNRAA